MRFTDIGSQISGYDFLWIKKLYPKDRMKALKSLYLSSLDDFLKYFKLSFAVGTIMFCILNYEVLVSGNIQVVFGLNYIIHMIGHNMGFYFIQFISKYIDNSKSFKRWNYGVNKNGEPHKLIEPECSDKGYITEWVESQENYLGNSNIFIGVDLTNYKQQKQREDIINELLN